MKMPEWDSHLQAGAETDEDYDDANPQLSDNETIGDYPIDHSDEAATDHPHKRLRTAPPPQLKPKPARQPKSKKKPARIPPLYQSKDYNFFTQGWSV